MLKREEVVKAVERRNPTRVPMVRAKWWGQGLREQYGKALEKLEQYSEDVVQVFMPNPVNPKELGLSWTWSTEGAADSRIVIDEWSKLDEFVERLDAYTDEKSIDDLVASASAAHDDERYLLLSWWSLFFEAPWKLRGMENLMCDYYADPDLVDRLHDAMCRAYCRHIQLAADVLKADGFFTSDDLGHQTGPMMSPEVFRKSIYPFYRRVGDKLKNLGMHFWLHSCGDNTLLLESLIESGVDVFHPVQKHAMNEQNVVAEFGGRISFLAGIDVQHTLQEKTPEEVRAEVRFLVDTFDLPGGGMCIGAGNGIVNGTPIENIEAFLDEALKYGEKHRLRLSAPG